MSLNVVYFVKNNALWRRTIAPANYETAGCAIPWQQPSCAVGQTAAFCKTEDIKLLDNITVSDFTVEYFTSADTSTANADASDTTKTVAERNTALQSSTTVGVSLSVTKTVAGREVSQSGSVRSTRLDINASTIAPVAVPTTPTAPSVTASYAAPNVVTFTWPSVPGAVSYTFQYQLNGTGGAWTTAFTGQNTTSFSVSAGTHGNTVYGRASATNGASPAQTSSYSSTANVTIPIWVTPTLDNNWTNYAGGFSTAGYTKTSDGLVVLKGLIKRSGAVVSGETIFTLPVGYRPPFGYNFGVGTHNATTGAVSGRINVMPDGRVIASTGITDVWASLETISFHPTTSPYSWTTLGMINGWSNRNLVGDADPPFSYTTDGAGRVQIRGALSPGTQTDGTIITSPALPVGSRPPLYLHVAVRSGGNGYNTVGVDSSGNIQAKGGSAGTALFTMLSYLPTSYTGTWTNYTFQNSWTNFSGSYSSGQFTKTSDNMVVLKGLVRTGAPGTVIATLPAGFRPSAIALMDSSCANLWCRIDIRPNGEILTGTGTSSTWTSLDGLTFYAEQ